MPTGLIDSCEESILMDPREGHEDNIKHHKIMTI